MDRISKAESLSAHIGLFVFILSLLVVDRNGYSTNIYSVVPIWGWVGFGVALVGATLLTYHGAMNQQRRPTVHGVAIVFCTFGVFWFLARFLGFRFWTAARGDLLHHYGLAKSILRTGAIHSGDVYPPLHVLIAQIRVITGLEYGTLGTVISFTYYAVLMVGIVMVVRRLASRRVAAYVAVAAIPLIYQRFSHHLVPWVAYLSLVPWMFVLMDAHRSARWRGQQAWLVIGIVVVGAAIAIGHPMSALVGGMAIFILAATQTLGDWFNSDSGRRRPLALGLLLPLVLIYPIWYLSRRTFQRFLGTIVGSIFGEVESAGASVVSRAGSSGYTLQQLVVEYLVVQWGTALLSIGVAGVIAIFVFVRLVRQRASTNELSLVGLYVAGLTLAITLLAGNFITNGFAVYRINQLTLVASAVIIGCSLWWCSERAEKLRVARYAVLLIILIGVVTTPFTVYSETNHVNEQEFVGANYYLNNADWDVPVYKYQMSHVLSEYLLGTERSPSYQQQIFGPRNPLPHRLGYDTNETIAATIADDEFAVITKSRDTEWYKAQPDNKRPYLNYYNTRDKERLSTDSTVHRIYTNGGFDVWLNAN